MKITLLCYAVRTYLILYETLKKVPPKGCFFDIDTMYQKEVPIVNVVQNILNQVNKSTAIVSRNSTISMNRCAIKGFGTAIDMDTSSKVDLDSVSVTQCVTGINVTPNKNKEIIMPLNMKNSTFKDVVTVARAPEKMLIDVDNCDFEKIKIGFDFYVPSEDLKEIGLPSDTPQEMLLEAAKLIRENKDKNENTLIELISNSSLGKWLNLTSGIVTVGTPIISNLLTYFS
ncbi:hypothetical protein ERW49_18950 [Aliivibrio finisterrensis]|uniref:Uncharacterized protein n=1 Tax=Aliivibrio finisterrensis TaxID=511998 RepID=A0A4V1Z652_9GAMM|nr:MULTISPECIES: hypothetical protein [Aliivibrio]MDD9177058.1 hypothetical protein [Aliivibrio sp. S3TY1]MDD9194103.1 hypothetical protein [Aliivibrio sp. S2TY2]RYU40610.1 hypothetical protein ERW49_18950 [Aliivibrio finisterrensis]